MNSNDTNRNRADTQQEAFTEKSTRLHYLDWLRVLATLGVFTLHTWLPFDLETRTVAVSTRFAASLG